MASEVANIACKPSNQVTDSDYHYRRTAFDHIFAHRHEKTAIGISLSGRQRARY